MAIKFCEIKKYISRVARISICFRDGQYDNYSLLSDIPDGRYDNLYVYGIGMIDVEFSRDVYTDLPQELPQRIFLSNGYFMGCGLEIVVQEEPRDIERLNDDTLQFGDLRNYLQIGRNFLVVTKEDSWNEEFYEYRNEIPEDYNDMYVYGIGIEDYSDAISSMRKYGILDSYQLKQMVLVLSKKAKEMTNNA